MLEVENTALVVIDVQEKFYRVMDEKESLLENLQKLIKGILVLNIPIIHTEQYPKGLGLTLPEISSHMPEIKPISKVAFSCCGEENFLQELKKVNRKQLLVCGIESHVCVYQTVTDLLKAGYEVQVVVDVVTSRTGENKEIGLERMKAEGAKLTCIEMALFELLKIAEGDAFKEISKIVK